MGPGSSCDHGSSSAPAFPSVAHCAYCTVGAQVGRGRRPPRRELRAAAVRAGVRRRFAPRQLRHAHAVEMAREGIPITVIQRQLGHADLGVTSLYLRGIDNTEIIDTVHERRAPMMPANAGLRVRP